MKDQKLIEYVRQEKHLYDLSHKWYSDSQRKVKTWDEIGKKLNEDSNTCKVRWECLRNQFRKHLRSRKIGTVGPPKWKYYSKMSFLIIHMKDKNRCVETSVGDLEVQPEEETITKVEEIYLEEDCDSIQQPRSPKRIIQHPTVKRVSPILTKRPLQDDTNVKDDMDLFFESIKATVKKFNAGNKLLAKIRVFNVISELEGFDMNQQQPGSFLNSSSVAIVDQYSKATVENPSSPNSAARSHQTYLKVFLPENNS